MEQQKDYSHLTEDQNIQNCFTAYIIKSFRNQRIQYWKKQQREAKRLVSLDEMLEQPKDNSSLIIPFDNMERLVDKENSLENVICNKALLACITNLSERDRKIINLRIIYNMKHTDIAKRLGIKAKTVEKAYERLIKKMRTSLEGS